MYTNNVDIGNFGLIPPESKDSKGIQNTYNTIQYNAKQNEMIIEEDNCGIICNSIPFFFVIILATFILIMLIRSKVSFIPILIVSLVIIVLILLYILFLYLNVKHVKLIKNESLNLLTVKRINFLNLAKSTWNFNLQDVIVDIGTYKYRYKNRTSIKELLVITNTFKNTTDIDLNSSNIKIKPIKNIYHVITGIKEKTYTTLSIRNFLGANPETENPVYFNINKYMGRSSDIPSSFIKYNFSRYMKISNYFFSYYPKKPCLYCDGYTCLIMTIIITLFFSSGPITGLILADTSKMDEFLPVLIMLIVFLIIGGIVIMLIIIGIKKYSLRMDIIYSKDFDTIFIALLNHNGTSYKKTYIHDINSIEKFIIDNYNYSNDKSILKVVYKNKNVEDIIILDECKYALDELLFILNERINKYQQV